MEIITASEAHILGIVRLEKLCFTEPWSEKMVAEEIRNPNAHYFLAVSMGEVLGYAGIQTVLDEGYITNIAVDPGLRKQGVGGGLLDAVLGFAGESGLSFVTLEVREGNSTAISLYKGRGFKAAGRRRGYYHAPEEDAILFTLWL